MNNHKILNQTVEKIKKNKVDIVIGTQMIAKGHDFPNLKLVGIVDSDVGLSGCLLYTSPSPRDTG